MGEPFPNSQSGQRKCCHLRISSLHCKSGGEISPTFFFFFSQSKASDTVRSAARSNQAVSIQSGDAQQMHRRRKKKKRREKGGLESDKSVCGGVEKTLKHAEDNASSWSPTQTADPLLCVSTSRRWFQLCALTCTDASGPVFTPSKLQPAGGVGFQQLLTRDITESFGLCPPVPAVCFLTTVLP